MANQNLPFSPPTPSTPARARNHSISLSAVHSSPLLSGSLTSYPITTVSFESSPNLSHSDNSLGSPDYLEPFEYTSDMDADFQRIDAVAASQLDNGAPSSSAESEADSPPPTQADLPPSPAHTESRPPTPYQKQRTWVVFQGREPGIYDHSYAFSPQPKQASTLTSVFLGCLRLSKLKGSVTIFNEPTPRGAPICVTERSLVMAGPLGSFLLVDGSALRKGCRYFVLDS